MAVDPVVERPEFVLRRLQGQGFAELRLSAGTLEEDHEVARHGERDGTAEILFHERQRQIDAGRDPRRGPDRTVAYENRIGLDAHGGEALSKLRAVLPVGRGAPPIEQACGGEQECAGAHGRDAARLPRSLPHPVDQRRIRGGGLGAFAAGDQKRIQQLSDRRERPRCEG